MSNDEVRSELEQLALDGLADRVRYRDQHIATYRKLRREERNGYGRWLLLIKELRVTHGVSILEAERLALANRHRRKWIEGAINSQQVCRKHALAHIRYNGEASLIEREGETFNFKVR